MDISTKQLKNLFALVSAALARERNALNPAVALPPEVLVEILRQAGMQAVTRASKVCHKWRVCVIAHDDLWTTIDMADPGFSDDILLLQLARSGGLPLNVNFHILDEGRFFYNIKIPYNIELLFPQAKAISNIADRTFLTKVDMPELESLHLTMGPRPLTQFIGSTPKLRYLAVDDIGPALPNRLPQGLANNGVNLIAFLDNLPTLHLRGGNFFNAQSVIDLLGSLHHLQEVLLACFKKYPNLDVSSAPHNTHFAGNRVFLRPLKLLVLRDLPVFFLRELLDSITLPGTANMCIDDWPGHSPLNLINDSLKSDAKAVYIHPHSYGATDADEDQTIYYEHDLSISQITMKGCNPRGFALPSALRIPPIEALTYITDRPHSVFIWRGLGNLRNLSFTFTPGLLYGLPTSLEAVLSDELRQYCPRLEYIGIVLKKAAANSERFGSSGVGFKDQAESVIPAFLEDWFVHHGKKFISMCIQDEIKPYRWEICFPVFEAFIERFEIGHVSLALPVMFGSTTSSALKSRQFQPDLDPRSTSLSCDRTAYSRLNFTR
jgi:hypothetical protein